MSLPNQLVGKNIQSTTCYNNSASAIPYATAVALDSGAPPQTYGAPGVKTTTGATDGIGFALTAIPAYGFGSVQIAGLAVAIAGAAVTFGTDLAVKTDNAGKVVAKTAGTRSIGVPFSSAAGDGEYIVVQIGAGVDNG
jgi:hypothetical protein